VPTSVRLRGGFSVTSGRLGSPWTWPGLPEVPAVRNPVAGEPAAVEPTQAAILSSTSATIVLAKPEHSGCLGRYGRTSPDLGGLPGASLISGELLGRVNAGTNGIFPGRRPGRAFRRERSHQVWRKGGIQYALCARPDRPCSDWVKPRFRSLLAPSGWLTWLHDFLRGAVGGSTRQPYLVDAGADRPEQRGERRLLDFATGAHRELVDDDEALRQLVCDQTGAAQKLHHLGE
jgi:hypothetical protein